MAEDSWILIAFKNLFDIIYFVLVGSFLYFMWFQMGFGMNGWLYWPHTNIFPTEIDPKAVQWLSINQGKIGKIIYHLWLFQIALHPSGLLIKLKLPTFKRNDVLACITWEKLQNPEILKEKDVIYLQWDLGGKEKTLQLPLATLLGIKKYIPSLEEKHQFFLQAQTAS